MTLDRHHAHAITRTVVDGYRLPPQFHMRLANVHDVDDIVITIEAGFPDIRDTTKLAVTYKTSRLWHLIRQLDDDDAIRAAVSYEIHRTCKTLWDHEFHEWTTLDGVHIIPPHPPGHPSVVLGLLSPAAQAQITGNRP